MHGLEINQINCLSIIGFKKEIVTCGFKTSSSPSLMTTPSSCRGSLVLAKLCAFTCFLKSDMPVSVCVCVSVCLCVCVFLSFLFGLSSSVAETGRSWLPLTCCRALLLPLGLLSCCHFRLGGRCGAVRLCSCCALWLSWLSSPVYLIQHYPPVSAPP